MDIARDFDHPDTDVSAVHLPAAEHDGGHFTFAHLLARTLPRFAMTAVPIRALAVSSDDVSAAALVMRLRAALGPECEIAAIDERTAGVLCYAPSVSRSPARRGAGGCGLLARVRPLAAALPLDIRTLDLSSVECADADDLLMALRRAPVRRLTAPGRPALAA